MLLSNTPIQCSTHVALLEPKSVCLISRTRRVAVLAIFFDFDATEIEHLRILFTYLRPDLWRCKPGLQVEIWESVLQVGPPFLFLNLEIALPQVEIASPPIHPPQIRVLEVALLSP